MGIITTIPTNLNFPNRGVLERDAFVLAQETAQDLLAGAYTTALNQYATELNETQTDINTKAEQVYNQAVTGGYSQAYIDATFTPKILNTQTAKTTPVDADLIPLSDSASSFGLKKLSLANLKTVLFGSPALTGTPTAPTPSSSDNSTKLATTEWNKLGFVYSFTTNGYIKFPNWLGGLTIQWGRVENNNSLGSGFNTIVFPISFTNECFSIAKMNIAASGGGYNTSDASFVDGALTASGATWIAYLSNNTISTTPSQVAIKYIAIGH